VVVVVAAMTAAVGSAAPAVPAEALPKTSQQDPHQEQAELRRAVLDVVAEGAEGVSPGVGPEMARVDVEPGPGQGVGLGASSAWEA